jgi:hypothetical protein
LNAIVKNFSVLRKLSLPAEAALQNAPATPATNRLAEKVDHAAHRADLILTRFFVGDV